MQNLCYFYLSKLAYSVWLITRQIMQMQTSAVGSWNKQKNFYFSIITNFLINFTLNRTYVEI